MSDYSARTALAPAMLSERAGRTLQEVLLVLVGTAILALSAKFKVPFYPVPMTLQTLAVMLIAATYGMRLGVTTMLAYLAEGALGLPVFANTPPMVASLGYLLGPTGGFLIAYPIAALIIGYAADRGWDRSVPKLFAALVAGEVVIFGLGFAWLAWFAHTRAAAAPVSAAPPPSPRASRRSFSPTRSRSSSPRSSCRPAGR